MSRLSRMQEFSGEYPLSPAASSVGGASVSVTLTLVKEPPTAMAGKVTAGRMGMGEVPSVQMSHQVEEETLVAMETAHGRHEGEGPEGGACPISEPSVVMGDATQTADSHVNKYI